MGTETDEPSRWRAPSEKTEATTTLLLAAALKETGVCNTLYSARRQREISKAVVLVAARLYRSTS